MKKISLSMVLLLICLVIVACGKDKYEPQPINPEVDICVVCKMAIKDDQYATQIITTEGQSLKFDDIGDMNVWKKENGTTTIGASFVRDYYSLEWIKYEDAFYVYDDAIQTPMAYGIVSFESEKGAEQFIAEHGSGAILTSESLADHSWESNHDHGHGHGDGHGHDGEHGHEGEHEDELEHEGEHGHEDEHSDNHAGGQ